jgi:hypothetical protein
MKCFDIEAAAMEAVRRDQATVATRPASLLGGWLLFLLGLILLEEAAEWHWQ